MPENPEEIEIDDDALALAAGGLASSKQSPTYTINSTIYFQSSAGGQVT